MSSQSIPACKMCRREGSKLYIKGTRCYSKKCPFDTVKSGKNSEKAVPPVPGMHGQSMQRKLSDYGQQLREKQKLKRIYGMREKQFSIDVAEAVRQPGVTGENLLRLLEVRLDNVAFRLGFGFSRKQAKQLVSHGHVQVNGKKVDIPSYKVKVGDVVSVCEKARSIAFVVDCLAANSRNTPLWLSLDAGAFSGKVVSLPSREQIDTDVNEQLIVEYYSR
ncbi:MAG: 30S ribosomal protein S4 [Abditibacteriota bacterium]|nr:30S ribosomal protein S4 [Abditibacteriota bacterium]